MTPKISIIVPVYNNSNYLTECLNSICNQTFKEIEILCINDGSTDNSLALLNQLAENDERILVFDSTHEGAALSRNKGIERAKGDYIAFMDSDDMYPSESVLDKMYNAIKQSGVMICGGSLCVLRNGIVMEEHETLEKEYRFCEDGIVLYKDYQYDYGFTRFLYNRKFLLSNNILFPHLTHQEDPVFFIKAMSLAQKFYALKTPTYLYRTGYKRTIWSEQKTTDLFLGLQQCLVLSKKYGLRALHIKLWNRLQEWGIRKALSENYYLPSVRKSYLSAVNELDTEIIQEALKRQLDTSKQIIVSVTSYPARINEVILAIKTIYRQTKQPDKVILWLGEDKFPNKCDDLPEKLLQLVTEKRLEIRWCEDLGPHTKYFYAFKEYPDALIITIDDDKLYPPDRIESLYRCYLRFPRTISAARADFIPISEQGEMPPVTTWPEAVDAWVLQPSMQLYATGANAVLYPTILFSQVIELLDKEIIRRVCPYSDDLWLKAMEAMAGIPVVVSELDQPLPISTVESQDTALWHYNYVNGDNNKQWLQIQQELDDRYGNGTLSQKLLDRTVGKSLIGNKSLCDLVRYLQKKEQKIKNQYAKFYTLRVDIKNNGGKDCNLVERIVTPKAFSVRKPAWLKPNGVTIESQSERMKIVVQCEGDGELEINLLGRDMRNTKRKRYPVWIDVHRFTVNGEIIFEDMHTVCYNKRYTYKRPVSDGEMLDLELAWGECQSSVILDEYNEMKMENMKINKKIADIKNSRSYKIGRMITFIPRKIREMMKI